MLSTSVTTTTTSSITSTTIDATTTTTTRSLKEQVHIELSKLSKNALSYIDNHLKPIIIDQTKKLIEQAFEVVNTGITKLSTTEIIITVFFSVFGIGLIIAASSFFYYIKKRNSQNDSYISVFNKTQKKVSIFKKNLNKKSINLMDMDFNEANKDEKNQSELNQNSVILSIGDNNIESNELNKSSSKKNNQAELIGNNQITLFMDKDENEDNVEETKLNTTFNKHQINTSLLDTIAKTNSNPQVNENIFKINRNNTNKINEFNLIAYVENKMPEGNFYCPLFACPFKARSKTALRDHYKNHVFIQKIVCKLCTYYVEKEQHMIQHTKLHENNKCKKNTTNLSHNLMQIHNE